MFGLGLATKTFIATETIDMGKGFEALHGLVRDHLNTDAGAVGIEIEPCYILRCALGFESPN